MIVSSGGVANFTTLSGGYEYVSSGGVASGTVLNGGVLLVSSGGLAVNTTVSAHYLALEGGVARGTVLEGGNANRSSEYVEANSGQGEGVSYDTTVLSGAIDYIYSGGVTSFTTVSYGGQDIVGLEGIANFTTVSVGGGEVVSSGGVTNFATVSSGGFQSVSAGGIANAATVSAGGTQDVYGSASATTVLAAGQEVVFAGGVASLTTVSTGGQEIVSSGGSAVGTDLLVGGQLRLGAIVFASGGTASLDSSTDILTISEGGQSVTEQLTGNYTGEYFHLARDRTTDGTLVTVSTIPCYCRGTRIGTERGEVPVESLSIGDRLLTVSGEARPIRWIGVRSYAGRFARLNPAVLPVRIKAGALADGIPTRDLLISPKHAMFVDGVLIPAECLVNGTTIRQVGHLDLVEYFHLELDSHDVILAEGAPSESFVDDDGRGMFHNAAEYRVLYPDASPDVALYCAPRVESGFALEAVRRRLDMRARQMGDAAA